MLFILTAQEKEEDTYSFVDTVALCAGQSGCHTEPSVVQNVHGHFKTFPYAWRSCCDKRTLMTNHYEVNFRLLCLHTEVLQTYLQLNKSVQSRFSWCLHYLKIYTIFRLILKENLRDNSSSQH